MNIITSFTGDYRFLSNFWRVPITYDGNTYPTVEHAYQAAKIDPRCARYKTVCCDIRNAPTPGEAKRMGRRVQMRTDWHNMKLVIMRELVAQKFTKFPLLITKLVTTAPATIVEGNSWNDRYWGVCDGYGENHLGRILMEIRTGLIKETDK